MLYKELEKIVLEEKQMGSLNSYVRNLLKEYLQIYILYFVYTDSEYNKKLIFTGGTCLRQFFGLERLSEDLDFDYLKGMDGNKFSNDIKTFLNVQYKYRDVDVSIKQAGKQILLKFPVLHQLGLAKQHESNLLYVKIDLDKNNSKHYSIQTTSKSKYGFNFVANHYDLSTLMAGKIHAILMRKYLKGKDDRLAIKGRDYFDLLWFMKNSIKPNMKRLSDILNKKMTLKDIETQVDEKVNKLIAKYKTDFRSDLVPLINNPKMIKYYVDNYYNEYLRYKSQSFSGGN